MTRLTPSLRLLATLLLLAGSTALAQDQPVEPRWWFGGYTGLNISFFGGALHDLDEVRRGVAPPGGFDAGSGLGLALGGLVEYRFDNLWGATVALGYDNRSVGLNASAAAAGDTIPRPDLSLSLSYLSLEPSARISIPGIPVHVFAGPGIGINLERAYELTSYRSPSGRDTSVDAELTDVRSLVLTAHVGAGYDIDARDLLGPNTLITPMALVRFGQGPLSPPDGSPNDFGLTSVRLGVQVRFGSASDNRVVVRPEEGTFDFQMRVPRQIVASRRINETFPLRNDIFFDPGSTTIPERYHRATREQAASFREEQLAEEETMTGRAPAVGARERRQMTVYYESLNILGDRMRRNPDTRVRLVGAGNGDPEVGLELAGAVRDHLVTTFGIEPTRIDVVGQPMPDQRAGSGASLRGDDAALIAAENTRVTFSGPEVLMRPVRIMNVQEEPLTNDLIFTLPVDSMAASWTVEVAGAGRTETFGPFTGRIARVPGSALIAGAEAAELTARIIALGHDGVERVSDRRGFRLQRGLDDVELAADRYSILFEFDDSKTVKTYERFLTETVAPSIPHAAVVVVHGHTDLIGDADYNAKLSQSRAQETQRVLSAELQKQGKYVTFDTYGFGEDEQRAPFANTRPEHRYYNRTVVIEVVQGE